MNGRNPMTPHRIKALAVLLIATILAGCLWADPVIRRRPDYPPSKIWTQTVELADDEWTCRSLADRLAELGTVEKLPPWRTWGFFVDTYSSDPGTSACMMTDLTTAEAATRTCSDADFIVPGGLVRPWNDDTLAVTSWCGRSASGTTTITAGGSY